jgi:hypothetical protein
LLGKIASPEVRLSVADMDEASLKTLMTEMKAVELI